MAKTSDTMEISESINIKSKYNIYLNILELIKLQELNILTHVINGNATKTANTASTAKLTEKQFTECKYITIKTHAKDLPKKKKFFIFIVTNDGNIYKSNEMYKIYKSLSEIKSSSRNYTLDCYTIGNSSGSKYTVTVFPKISDNTKDSYIRHRYFPERIFCINILKHKLLNYKFKIIKEKDALFEELGLNKYNDKWENILPKILYSDPVSAWLGLEDGDILYYDGYYRECVIEVL